MTTLSKILAGTLFILFPFIGFYLGMKYQMFLSPKVVEPTAVTNTPTSTKTPTTSPDPTADWKTYTNNTTGISFKYPQSWYLHSDGEEGFSIFSTNPEMGGNLAGISMRMKTYSTNFNDSTFMKKLEQEYLSFGHGNVEENRKALRIVLIAGIKAYSGDSDAAPENLWDHYYFFYHNNKIYDITATEDIGFPERKESELFNQILSTFKFAPQ